jgi:tetratricopeptide (TPR) repeat protein
MKKQNIWEVTEVKTFVFVVLLLFTSALILPIYGCASESESHYNAGVKLHEQGRWEEAIAEYNKAIELDPNLAIVYNNRGAAYFETGQYDLAIADFNKAIELDPNLAMAYANRALAYTILGMDTEAEQDVEIAVQLGIDREFLEGMVEQVKQMQ